MPDMDIMGPKEAMLSWTLETNAKKFKPAHPNEHFSPIHPKITDWMDWSEFAHTLKKI